MRLQFMGRYTPEGLEEVIKRAILNLTENGVDMVEHVNLYLKPCNKGRWLQLEDAEGQEIDHLVFDELPKREFKAVTEGVSSLAKQMIPKTED